MKPNFSIVLICRNEEKVIPRMFNSLIPFRDMGGDIVVCDTGSVDSTVKIAKDFGCTTVVEVGDRFLVTIDKELADNINKRFIVDGEESIIKEGDKLFDFSAARNYASSLSKNDLVSMQDCDEEYTKLDIDKICSLIDEGYDQLEYHFIFSHDQFGNPNIAFTQSKFYNKKKLEWQGVVHEVLQPIVSEEIKRLYIEDSIFKLEHWQNPETPRGNYLRGLSLDCFLHPDKDRQSHYFGRELVWNNRPKSAIKELERHISMKRWRIEESESMIFIADAYGQLNEGDKQIEWYNKSFIHDSSRREALIKLAYFFKYHNEPQKVVCYAKAAMEIPWNSFYANQRDHYENIPHELLYWGYGWLGRISEARDHILKALEYQPTNSIYLRDTHYYITWPKVSIIIPTLGREEKLKRCLEAIKETANYPNYEVIVEYDSFENRQGACKTFCRGLEKSTGEYILILANDNIPQKDFLLLAMLKMMKTWPEADGLVGLNDMYWHGEFATHPLIQKKLYLTMVDSLSEYYHCGADNELTERCRMIGKYVWCEEAKIYHDHPVHTGWDEEHYDAVYKIAYDPIALEHDRTLLYEHSKKYGFELRENFTRPE